MFASNSDIVDYHVLNSFLAVNCADNYVRVQPNLEKGGCSSKLDAARGLNPAETTIHGFNYSHGADKTVDEIAEILIANQPNGKQFRIL